MFLSRKAVCDLVSLSKAHIARLEEEGKFPRRVRLTDHPRGRVAWVKQEVEKWAADRIAKRAP